MSEIEAQAIAGDERAFLRDVIAEHEAQRLMQKMRRRMIGPDRRPACVIDCEFEREAGSDLAYLQGPLMHENIAELFLRIGDAEAHAIGAHDAGIADLSARFAIEGRLIEDDGAGLAGAKTIGLPAVLDDRGDDAFGALRLIAEEIGRAGLLPDRKPDVFGRRFARSRPRPARVCALARHGGLEPFDIDAERTGAQRVLRQIERKAERIVKPEGDLTGQDSARRKIAHGLVEDRKAARQRIDEARLLEPQCFDDQRLGPDQLRIGLPHFAR